MVSVNLLKIVGFGMKFCEKIEKGYLAKSFGDYNIVTAVYLGSLLIEREVGSEQLDQGFDVKEEN